MSKQIILTQSAPQPVGPYSQAVRQGGFVYLAGQIPLTPDGNMVEGGVADQTRQVFANIKAVLAEAGLTLDHVVKTTVFLTDLGDFAAMNAIYAEHFKAEIAPARSTVEVSKLPLGSLVEIEVIASDG